MWWRHLLRSPELLRISVYYCKIFSHPFLSSRRTYLKHPGCWIVTTRNWGYPRNTLQNVFTNTCSMNNSFWKVSNQNIGTMPHIIELLNKENAICFLISTIRFQLHQQMNNIYTEITMEISCAIKLVVTTSRLKSTVKQWNVEKH